MSAAMKVLVNDIIVLEHILKFIEMVLDVENDFQISEFYRIHFFEKVDSLQFFFEFSKLLENDSGRGSCPSSYPSGNQVDGLPLVAISWRSKTC